MNLIGFLFTMVNSALVLWLPRRSAPLPLLVGTVYMTAGQGIDIGTHSFPVIRLLIAAGILRVLLKGERVVGKLVRLDYWMIFWSIWAVISSAFHEDGFATLANHLGLVFNAFGIYILMRIFIRDAEDLLRLSKMLLLLLIPLAMEMILEARTGHNAFTLFGGVMAESEMRGGKIRAQGPFTHAIMAGTAGAVSLPWAFLHWHRNRLLALSGIFATVGITLSSASSGPIMTLMSVLGALGLWKFREHLRFMRRTAVVGLIALAVVMNSPVYYIISYIDLTGSSTGWHRAYLIESAINHLDEWWWAGTDVTRHWMPTGVGWSEKHTDITNEYISMGVAGGLPLMFLFIAEIASGFVAVGQVLKKMKDEPSSNQFVVWTVGAILFGHAVTLISVGYWGQISVFLYLVLAAAGSLAAARVAQSENVAAAMHKTDEFSGVTNILRDW